MKNAARKTKKLERLFERTINKTRAERIAAIRTIQKHQQRILLGFGERGKAVRDALLKAFSTVKIVLHECPSISEFLSSHSANNTVLIELENTVRRGIILKQIKDEWLVLDLETSSVVPALRHNDPVLGFRYLSTLMPSQETLKVIERMASKNETVKVLAEALA